jgi:(1->4)-alpha-D-glucan 1-alpha-D-glucosylmutase
MADDERVVAFARRLRECWTLTVVPRFVSRLAGAGRLPVGRRVWKDISIEMPAGAPPHWRDVFTGETVNSALVGDILHRFPVALLTGVVS